MRANKIVIKRHLLILFLNLASFKLKSDIRINKDVHMVSISGFDQAVSLNANVLRTPCHGSGSSSESSEGPNAQLQWLGCSGFRLRITNEYRDGTIYIDPHLTNPMMPKHLKLRMRNEVVPTDATAIIVTHNAHGVLSSAVPMLLAAIDEECRIFSTKEVVSQILSTRMVGKDKLVVLNQGCPNQIARLLQVTLVHSSQRVKPRKLIQAVDSDESSNTPGAADKKLTVDDVNDFGKT